MDSFALFLSESELSDQLLELMEQANPEEQKAITSVKQWASNILEKAKSVISPKNVPKNYEAAAQKYLQQLKAEYQQYENLDYPKEILQGFDFFKQIPALNEGIIDTLTGFAKSKFMQAVWAVIKWLLLGLIDILNAALILLQDSVTPAGLIQIIIFWVFPIIAMSPLKGGDLLGLSPFIGWVIFHAIIKPAIYKMGGAKRVPGGSYSPLDPKRKAPLGQGFTFDPAQTSGQTPNLASPD